MEMDQQMETKVIRHPLVDVRGIPLQVPLAMYFARVDEFQAFKDDLLIATYPKAGTTWTQEIVDLILNEGNEKCRRAPINVRMPFLEIATLDPSDSGEVGDWQNHFSPQEDAIFEEHYHRMMADTPIPFRFDLN